MAYKDSFVDEYPYLVYSDDPEAMGGAGGGDIGIALDSLHSLVNSTSNAVDAFILARADDEKAIATTGIDANGSLGIAPNAFIGIPATYYIHVGELDAGSTLEPIGSFTVSIPFKDPVEYNIYQLAEAEQYSIVAS